MLIKSKFMTQLTAYLFHPYISKRQLGEKFHISAEYSSFNNIESKGISPSTDVFNEGGLAFTALTEYNITEDIHELTISVLYEAWSNDNWNLNFGPALSISYSDTDFELPLSNFHLRNYTETDETMGF
jgi:hypothetical protein